MNNDIMRYILMKKEKEMGHTLDPDQEVFYSKMEAVYNSDEKIKADIDKVLNAEGFRNVRSILNGQNKSSNIVIVKEDNDIEYFDDDDIIGETDNIVEINSENKDKQLVLTNKKAGFADILVLSLVTGYISGMALALLYLMV